MTWLYEDDLGDVGTLAVRATEAEVVNWHGRRALKLVGGLALVPDLKAESFSMRMRRPGSS